MNAPGPMPLGTAAVLREAGSLTPAIWLPGITEGPCTKGLDLGGMVDCKESLRSSVLICSGERKSCISTEGIWMTKSEEAGRFRILAG